jgi:type I restriction enzyme, S subunit
MSEETPVSFVPMSDLGETRKYFPARGTRHFADVVGSYTYFEDGDVLCAKITPCFENGKLGIAKDLENGIGFGSSEFFVIRPKGELLPEFLFYFLSRNAFRECGKRVMSGAVGHKRVPKDFFEGLELPLPPLDEQKRIVAALDHTLAALDRASANVELNCAQSAQLADAWVRGVFGSASDWPTRRVADVCENLDRQRVPITKGDREQGNIPYYGASGVVDHVKDFLFDEDLLLVSEDGANLLARSYPIAFSISGKAWVNNHAHVLRFSNRATQEFVRLYLNSISLRPYVTGMAQPKLNQGAMNDIPVPTPPIEVQEEIVRKADQIAIASKRVADAYEAQRADIAALRQSLLQAAFSGQLS